MPSSRFIPYLLLLIAMLCWAGNYVVGRAIQGQIPPLNAVFFKNRRGGCVNCALYLWLIKTAMAA
jgi:hypothetical protein